MGWHLEKNSATGFVISKPLNGIDLTTEPGQRIISTDRQTGTNNFSPAISSKMLFGSNRFRGIKTISVRDSTVTFIIRNFFQANRVMLAGSFNNWSPSNLAMRKTNNGWEAGIKLAPGKHTYKFVVDGRWLIDPENQNRENDGRGNTNSVYFRPNVIFVLRGYTAAKKVYLSGSFNNWRPRDIALQKMADGWELPLYLTQGTHTYRFIVDGNWMADPNNSNRLPNEYNEYNSVIRLGKPFVFRLPGYLTARPVVLSGSFNNWRSDELFMQKTPAGWELPYTLGPGNYEYRFRVDGKWMADPANPVTVSNSAGNKSFYLILNPNHTFRLKNSPDARQVFLAGDFNNWSPTALRMKKVNGDWVFSVYLAPGKTCYKFVVDGKWIIDPGNKLWEQNEYGTGNSILWLE